MKGAPDRAKTPDMKKDPDDCHTMSQLRCAIDGLDVKIMGLLVERARFIDRAAVLKHALGWPARLDDRVEEVVQNAWLNAQSTGFDPDLAMRLWREIIDWSIAREECTLGRPGEDPPETEQGN